MINFTIFTSFCWSFGYDIARHGMTLPAGNRSSGGSAGASGQPSGWGRDSRGIHQRKSGKLWEIYRKIDEKSHAEVKNFSLNPVGWDFEWKISIQSVPRASPFERWRSETPKKSCWILWFMVDSTNYFMGIIMVYKPTDITGGASCTVDDHFHYSIAIYWSILQFQTQPISIHIHESDLRNIIKRLIFHNMVRLPETIWR